MAQWEYAPVAIAEEDPSTGGMETCSGVYLVKDQGPGYILTIGSGQPRRVYATAKSLITEERIEWAECVKVTERVLTKVDNALGRFSRGYRIEPSRDRLVLSVYKFSSPKHVALDPVSQSGNNPTGKVKVHCSPFASVNPALFLGYMAHGSISHASLDLILSDVRYMDGMTGGVVIKDDGSNESIGLVLGRLRKLNKDGELTVIAPWSAISPKALGIEHSSESHGVAALSVKRVDGAVLWASGVLIAPDIIVTNAHVVRNSAEIIAAFSNGDRLKGELWGTPIDGMDLAFVRLTTTTPQTLIPPIRLATSPVTTGQQVKSIGFGLFHPDTLAQAPLTSEGHVSRVIEHRLWDSPNAVKTQALMVASSGCWNGSSGGAVVDVSGQLVGIMASNGKTEAGEIIPTMAFVIPWQVVQYGLHLLKTQKSVEISPKLRKLWKLDQTHDNVLTKL